MIMPLGRPNTRQTIPFHLNPTFSSTVATVGFPDIGLQGFAPKVLAHGHHGGNRHWEVELRPEDDPRYFQISVR